MFNAFAWGLLAPLLLAGPSGTLPAEPVVRGKLLPHPPDPQISVRAVDVSPRGVVVGNALATGTVVDLPQRWVPLPRAGWVRQPLALPAGATSGTLAGLTDRGEAAGSVTLADGRAARWSITGRSVTLLGTRPSTVTAAGPDGPWGVTTADPANPIQGDAELVTRSGERTPLRGTPELDGSNRRSVDSVGGPGTALVRATSGFGRGTTWQLVLWRDGATLPFPVVGSFLLGPACAARIQADGSTVYSGYLRESDAYSFVLVRHIGGIPGADVVLSRATAADQPRAGLDCSPGATNDTLASDGGVAGWLLEAGRQQAAHWDAAGTRTVVPLEPGEQLATGAAAASGNRMVIVAQREDGTRTLALWNDGVRTGLTTPPGWTLASVVELTDAGLLVANLRNAGGTLRPATWRLPPN